MLGLRKDHSHWCNKPLTFKKVLKKTLKLSTLKVWIHLLSFLNNRDEGVGITLLPLFNVDNNKVKKIRKKCCRMKQKMQLNSVLLHVGTQSRTCQTRRAWDSQKLEIVNVQGNRALLVTCVREKPVTTREVQLLVLKEYPQDSFSGQRRSFGPCKVWTQAHKNTSSWYW